jgi:flagellar basal body P-ring formation protein FlgA
MRKTFLWLMIVGGAPCAWATAMPTQSLADIQTAVEDYVTAASAPDKQEIALTVGRLDPRLRLAACDIPLQASQNPGTRLLGATSVNVRCEGVTPWSIFVPAMIREKRSVVVATRSLAPGQQLQPADVTTQAVWVSDATTPYLEDTAQAIGKQTQRLIPAGSPLPVQGLRSPRAIRRGAAVTLALERGPLAIRVGGVALQDGALGDRIQARNNSSRRVVEGVLAENGVVRVR